MVARRHSLLLTAVQYIKNNGEIMNLGDKPGEA